jgi:3-isopropylmalate dehydrogenase
LNTYSVCLIKGDGIGPEITGAALSVLDTTCSKFGIRLEYQETPGGDSALKQYGDALPHKSLEIFENTDACLKGPVGETVNILNNRLRFNYDLYANLRPAKSYPGITPPAIRPDIDLMIIRENSEGFYRAIENEIARGTWTSTGVFTEAGARRIAELSFNVAETRKSRNRKVTLATKSNIFRNSHGMYLRVFKKISKDHPTIEFEHLYADALCARLVRDPQNFDVIASENLLADLLSDLAGQIAGGLGLTPRTNINYETRRAYFEPTHGSAPDIAGKGLANPIGQIRAGALMLSYLGIVNNDKSALSAANSIETAIGKYLNSGDRSILPYELRGSSNAMKVSELISLLIEN